MKKIITLIMIVLLPGLLPAQHCPYLKKYLLQGEQALQAGRFDAAIRAFTIAITHCPDSAQLGSEGVNRTYKALDALKIAAETAKEQALREKKQAEAEKTHAELARKNAVERERLAIMERETAVRLSLESLNQIKNLKALEKVLKDSLRLAISLKKEAETRIQVANQQREQAIKDRIQALRQISKMYFYKDSFGIAYDDVVQKYGFVDRNMETRIDFKYETLNSFETETGFAKGKRDKKELTFHLISTQGREYPLATEIYQIKPSTRAIDFRYKELNSIPYAVYRYDSLQILLLDGNNIRHLSDYRLSRGVGAISKNLRDWLHNSGRVRGKLKHLSNVEVISLANNQIRAVEPEVRKLKNLRTLNLSNNIIESVAAEIGNLTQLAELDLSNNRLDSLPPQIGQLHQLRRLDLSGNRFSEAELEKIRAWLPECRVYPEAALSSGQKQMQ